MAQDGSMQGQRMVNDGPRKGHRGVKEGSKRGVKEGPMMGHCRSVNGR